MGHFDNEDITNRITTNVFYNTFKVVKEHYKDVCKYMVWDDEDGLMQLFDTNDSVGSFDHSDIDIRYDLNTFKPIKVRETIYRRSYPFGQWIKMTMYLRTLSRRVDGEFGFKLKLEKHFNKWSIVHYK